MTPSPASGATAPADLLSAAQLAIKDGRLDAAAEWTAALRAADPSSLNPVLLDGWIAFHRGDLDTAIGWFEAAHRRRPSSVGATIIATAHHGRHRLDQAEAWFHLGQQLNPTDFEHMRRHGRFLWETNRLDEADATLVAAMALSPSDRDVAQDMAYCRLKAGDYGRGWNLLDRRWYVPGAQVGLAGPSATLRGTVWFMEPPAGRTILVLAEAGFGDVLQFSRFIPMLVARGADVVFRVKPEMARLFRAQAGYGRVVTDLAEVAQVDLICPIMSLGGRLGILPGDLPGAVAYLSAEPDLVAAWDRRLAASGPPARRVGIAWSGRPHRTEFGLDTLNHRRAIPFGALAPVLRTAGCRFVSLQIGPTASQAAEAPELLDWTAEITDFADTAALISALDLVITTDTSVAHLAGALGRPVWVLDRWDSCWRWLTNRPDSPWYPSLRIFRQATAGDWSVPVAAAATALAALPPLSPDGTAR